MQDANGLEQKYYWVLVLVTLPNGTQVPRYRVITEAQREKLRQDKTDFYTVSKSERKTSDRTSTNQ